MKDNKFIRILGSSPTAKILDLLLEGREFDYGISDIAKGSEVHRNTVSQVIELLIQEGIVIETRKLGKIQLYKIHLKNEIVISLFDMYCRSLVLEV